MKRAFCISIVLLAAIFVFIAGFVTSNLSAYADNEIEINSAADLVALADDVAAGNSTHNKTYVLTADIDLTSASFRPIGDNFHPFYGTFDGQGHNVTVDIETTEYGGLFGVVGNNGVITDVTVKGSVTAQAYSAGVVASNSGRVQNCVNEATVTRTGTSTGGHFGGVVGLNSGVIDKCINVGDVNANRYVGGVTGRSTGRASSISSCVNFGTIVATDYCIGGLVGENGGYIGDCYTFAAVNSTGYRMGSAIGYLSGFIGENYGRVYAVSSRAIVGEVAVTYPDTFALTTPYDLLYNDLFADGTLGLLTFDEGYGYLPCPDFVDGTAAKNYFRILLFDDGVGTAGDPFIIASIEEFRLFVQNTKIHNYYGKHVKLSTSLSLDGEVVGSLSLPFNGTFDGDDNEISYSLSGANYVGLFVSCGPSSSIKNLVVTAAVTSSGQEAAYAGLLAGITQGEVSNIELNGSVVGNEYVGALAGRIAGSVQNVVNNASVSGTRYVGGIAGYASSVTADSLVNNGAIDMVRGGSYSYFGGIFGYAEATAAEHIVNKGVINANRADSVGGIAGYYGGASPTVNYVASLASVSGRNKVGGIVGEGSASIVDYMVYTDIYGATYVGGVAGHGTNTVSYGYFSGVLDVITGATVDRTTFRTIAPAGSSVSFSFYNSDSINDGTDGSGLSNVQFTKTSFDRSGWESKVSLTDDMGYFPVLSSDVIDDIPYYYFGGGTGTEQDPYLIGDELSFRNCLYLVGLYSAVYASLYYVQSANITLTRTLTDSASSATFYGKYDGNGYVINEIESLSYLFDTLAEGGTIVNLAIESGVFASALVNNNYGTIRRSYSLAGVSHSGKVGAFAVNNYGTIVECIFSGYIEGAIVGGIVGENMSSGRVEGCSVNAYAYASTILGGIAGKNAGTIIGTMVAGTFDLDGSGNYLGGLSGEDVGGGRYYDSVVLGVFTVDEVPFDSTMSVGVICGYANNTQRPGVVGTVVYNSEHVTFFRSYTTSAGAVTNIASYARTTERIRTDGHAVFSNYAYTNDLPSNKNSHFAPRQSAFGNNADRLNQLSAATAKLPIFGWDPFSFDEWGTEGNPYLIKTAAQLQSFRTLSLSYTYDGEYFMLTDDISLSGQPSFHPIGQYVATGSAQNRAFNGTFDGNWHTIDYVNIEESDKTYVGLFAYTGSQFVLKNLILGSHSVIRSSVTAINNSYYVGGLVGYNGGIITDCINYAIVDGEKNIGGIVGISNTGTQINNVVFCGVIDETKDSAYGISAQNEGAIFTIRNAWYLRANPDGNTFIPAGTEGYVHNSYGSVLYVDRGGTVEVNVLDDEFRFILHPSVSEPVGKIMDGADGVIFEENGNGFYPLTNVNVSNGNSVKYYARFTSRLYASFAGDSADYLQNPSYGAGYYYQGQNVVLSFNVKNGYFLSKDAIYATLGVTYSNETATDNTEIIKIHFAKPAEEYGLPVTIEDFSIYGELTVNNLGYNGDNKIVGIDYATGSENFGAHEYMYYIGAERVTALNAAATYTIKVRIKLANEDHYFGALSENRTIAKASLTPQNGEYWQTFTSKNYDNSLTATATISNNALGTAINGIVESDLTKLSVSATITWASVGVGTVSADVTDFTLSGSAAGNYEISGSVVGVSATISKKVVSYVIAESALTGEYTGSKPAIVGNLSSSIYGATMTISFHKLLANNEVDPGWSGSDWNVGRYSLSISCSDSTNISLALADNYVFEITPSIVTTVNYSGYENLVYSASEQSIVGVFTTVSLTNAQVGIVYYVEDEEGLYLYNDKHYTAVPLLDAGDYMAVPQIVSNDNYVLSDAVNRCFFTVAKNSSAGDVVFSVTDSSTSVDIGSRTELTISDIYDATLVVEHASNTRGRAIIEMEDDKYYFKPTAYPRNGVFTFRLKAINSKNYEDRYSSWFDIEVVAGTIYLALAEESRTLVYGDVPSLELIYSYEDNFDSLIEHPEEIAGFIAPNCTIDGSYLLAGRTYSVSIVGGGTDGYRFSQIKDYRSTITVNKRKIIFSVTDDDGNGKIYGERDEDIAYSILDNEVDYPVKITVLPNGDAVNIVGKATREAGENAGRYAILSGTVTAENNPNYDIQLRILSDFVISKRNIELIVDAAEKYYGDEDPAITYSPTANTPYANGDDMNSVYVEVVRAPGEDVGIYYYSVESFSGLDNYNIIRVDYRVHNFVILRARPTVQFSIAGKLYYGDSLSVLTPVGSAFSNGDPVEGRLVWEDGTIVPAEAGVTVANMVFVPDSNNFESVTALTEITVLPRLADVGFEGNIEYIYNGQAQCNITAVVLNPVGNDKVKLVTSIEGAHVDTGKYFFRVALDASEKNYYIDGYAEIEFAIYAKIVTVKVADATIKEGEKYNPTITYDGFVSGETEGVLIKKATVESAPTAGGIYTVTASGAEANNYIFTYVSGTLVINKQTVRFTGEENDAGSTVEIRGDIPANVGIDVKYYDSGANLTYRQDKVDKGLKHNLFYPNLYQMTDYCEIAYTGAIEGELTYTVSVNYSAGDEIYLVMYDGSVRRLTDFELGTAEALAAAEGTSGTAVERQLISFRSEQISGVAVYTKKGTMDVIKSLLPDIIAAVVIVVAVIVIVAIARGSSKRGRAQRSYVKSISK